MVQVHADRVPRLRLEREQHGGLPACRLRPSDLHHETVVDQATHHGGDGRSREPGLPRQVDAAYLSSPRITSSSAARLLAWAVPTPAGWLTVLLSTACFLS